MEFLAEMTKDTMILCAANAFLMLALAASEALGKSKRFRANGVVQFLAGFVSAGCKGVMNPPGIEKVILDRSEPSVEAAIEAAIDRSSSSLPEGKNEQQDSAKPEAPAAQDQEHHNLTELS